MTTVQTINSYGVIWFLFYVNIIQGEPVWIVNEKVSGYGDNLTLFCLIDDCCTKAAGWIKFDPVYKTIYLDVRNAKNNTSKDKYAATINNTGFSLVIKNIQKEDINIKYSCLYGFEKSRQKILSQSDAFRGPDYRTSRCGNCSCTSNLTGENCGCSTRNDSCISSNGKTLCGGPERGKCECNRCYCTEKSKYQGTTCEDCKGCKMVCRQNKACVQCVAYQTGQYKDNCEENCGDRHIVKKPSLPEGYNTCEFIDDDDCIFYFTYDYDDNNELKIIAQDTKVCLTKDIVLTIVLGVVIGIVLVGLALLIIWKIVTAINDRRELARIEFEMKDAKYDTGENPVYKPRISTYRAPTRTVVKREKDCEQQNQPPATRPKITPGRRETNKPSHTSSEATSKNSRSQSQITSFIHGRKNQHQYTPVKTSNRSGLEKSPVTPTEKLHDSGSNNTSKK